MVQQATITDEPASSQPYGEQEKQILAPEAAEFLAELVSRFAPARNRLLTACQQQQQVIDQGVSPDFISETVSTRNGNWIIRGILADLQDRCVEVTGPAERKAVISVMSADVKVSMVDSEDSLAPDWRKVTDGQINLHDAVNGTIDYTNEADKIYQLQPNPAALVCRVCGLCLPEKHITWRNEAIPSSLFNFALYFFHNCQTLLAKGSSPYLYLPKTQTWQEAVWWNDIFSFTEDYFNLPRGTIRAMLLVETLSAVFQMGEILYALCDHIVDLDCGHWDYVFSYIKTLKDRPDRVLSNRQVVTIDKPFPNACSRLLTKTYHKRGVFAMGGTVALIPGKDAKRNRQALNKVAVDEELETNNGHDGTWIAHPGLVDVATTVFNRVLGDKSSQPLITWSTDAPITAEQLLVPCEGKRTEAGMRTNVRVAAQYIEAWISGDGCVPIYDLMENAVTAETPCTFVWQWVHHQKTLNDSIPATRALFRQWLVEELMMIQEKLGGHRFNHGRLDDTAQLMGQITTSDELIDFLILPGYHLPA